jgi:hypothetical protein
MKQTILLYYNPSNPAPGGSAAPIQTPPNDKLKVRMTASVKPSSWRRLHALVSLLVGLQGFLLLQDTFSQLYQTDSFKCKVSFVATRHGAGVVKPINLTFAQPYQHN